MGAINYFTSDYITMGLRPYARSDFENELDFMEEAREQIREYGGTLENVIDDYISECYEADFANIETELNKHNFPVAFDGWEDRKEANKEITEIKGFLIACAGLGLVQCSPGWCTGYNDYKGTIAAIKAAIKEMREEVKTIPTWAQYERAV